MEVLTHNQGSFQLKKALVSYVVASRIDIRTCLLDTIAPRDEQPLLLHALADSLIDRFVRGLDESSWLSLLGWAESVCNQRSRPAVRRLFQSFVPTLTEHFATDDLDNLAASLAEVVHRASSKHAVTCESLPSAEIVDEVDVLCADMLQRIESNDPKTAEHCRAVSAWCARIARRMSLTRVETMIVARGGLIHDVGKSKVPLEVLNAPRALSDTEMEVMRGHALVGHQIVSSYPKLSDLAGLVRSHHERFDGRGYPDKLDRTRIPIHVRIVSVADTFNAMIGRRPYRAPFSPTRAIAELQRAAGTQLDPDVVRALLDVISGATASASAA